MKVGFIGLGHMGTGMAANLLRAGHEVTVYNRTPGKAQGLVAQGARAAPVFGRPEMAAAAKLFIVAAGAPDAVDACLPLFEAMGQKTFPIGDQPKAANLVKLSGNFLSACVIPRPDEVVSRLLQRSHSYATDRLSLVLSGTWWVNSGADFDPEAT